MAGFQLTRTAREDLKAIGRFTQRTWGRRKRDTYLTQLDRRFHALAEMPSLGRPCDDIRPGYRRYAEGVAYNLLPRGGRWHRDRAPPARAHGP